MSKHTASSVPRRVATVGAGLTLALGCAGLALASGDAPAGAITGPACSTTAGVTSCIFTYQFGAQTWTVPSGITQVTVTADGAEGGTSGPAACGEPGVGIKERGRRGRGQCPAPGIPRHRADSPGRGGEGGDGSSSCTAGSAGGTGGIDGGAPGGSSTVSFSSGGGGGGASEVDEGGTAPADQLVVAGGGGGGANDSATGVAVDGGAGGGTSGADGSGSGICSPQATGGVGGGGTQVTGGTAGAGADGGGAGTAGDTVTIGNGGTGGADENSGGGGGGGFHGGGGGGASVCGGGGGGGSGFATARASHVNQTPGVWAGNGQVVISYSATVGYDLVGSDGGVFVFGQAGGLLRLLARPRNPSQPAGRRDRADVGLQGVLPGSRRRWGVQLRRRPVREFRCPASASRSRTLSASRPPPVIRATSWSAGTVGCSASATLRSRARRRERASMSTTSWASH